MKNDQDYLQVSEKFYSIQGEGVTMGVPAVFLRLTGCNLLCQSESWICDTIEVWRKGKRTPFADVLSEDDVDALSDGAHLVITGGEPMLHEKKIIKYLKWFEQEYKFKPYVEIETNGTIKPKEDLWLYVEQFNVSPKLSTSGETKVRRINENALKWFAQRNTIFKFVISTPTDVVELFTDFDIINERPSKIVLMPAGDDQDKLNKTRPMVMRLCMEQGLRYSDRLHIVAWNQKTGV